MAPAAFWAVLAVGLQLWAVGNAVPAQVPSIPYKPSPGGSCQDPKEYYNNLIQMCCAACPPGQHVKHVCTKTSDTVCADCEDSTYTQLWNWLPTCLSCGSRCGFDQVKTQACTRQQNRVCACKPDMYCALLTTDSCRQCMKLSKCGRGFGVVGTRSPNQDVVCKACVPGTFSDTISSTDTCRPHRTCSLVAIPGNASMDTVCAAEPPTSSATPGKAYRSLPQPTRSQSPELDPESEPSSTVSTSLGSPFSQPSTKDSVSLPIGLIVGVTALGLLVIGLVNCFILTQKRKKPFCLRGEAKAPHLPDEKARGAPGLEQQHLLTTAPSSSSSSLESSASARDRRAPSRGHTQPPTVQEARNSRGSDSSHSSHGTHVNVTCIVNVCNSSDHSSQCSSQGSASVGSPDAKSSGHQEDDQVPFSQEECPSRSHLETPETLLQSHEKSLPLGVPDIGMKPSPPGCCNHISTKVV